MRWMIPIFIIVLLSLSAWGMMSNRNYRSEIRLEKGEQKFRGFYSKSPEAYGFAAKISYFEIVSYDVDMEEHHDKNIANFQTILKIGHTDMTKGKKKQLEWLTAAIPTTDYFGMQPYLPYNYHYICTSYRFVDESGRFRAIDKKKDFIDIFGRIDNELKLYLWLYATDHGVTSPYSYKKIGDLYRVRFSGFSETECEYYEDFKYYNAKGKMVKEERIRKIKDKKCSPIML